MLFLTGAVVGVFAAQDLFLFYVFWEAMLIPLYVLIGVWGGARRVQATLKFVIYTMAGSLLMLASVIVLGLQRGSFDLLGQRQSTSTWIFLGFAAAFAVKAPLFPFHGWLPDAYRQSTPEVAAVLSGVVSKAATYGFLRIGIAQFGHPVIKDVRIPILVLAATGLVYGSVIAFRAPDLRGVIAYSSLAQMGLITLGLFAVNFAGLNGAVLQMVNHGLISATLFLLAGAVERRTGTGEFARLGGLARGRPALATVLMTTGIIALAVPGSTAFAGHGGRARPAAGRAGRTRAARRVPARPVGLAGRDHGPRLREGLAERAGPGDPRMTTLRVWDDVHRLSDGRRVRRQREIEVG
jgi:NADH-quinone oxidoreductase subunit M